MIEVSDYSSIRSNFRKMSNGEFVDLMDDDNASQREPWVKVRWINIGGLSWDVIKAVAIRYGGGSTFFFASAKTRLTSFFRPSSIGVGGCVPWAYSK